MELLENKISQLEKELEDAKKEHHKLQQYEKYNKMSLDDIKEILVNYYIDNTDYKKIAIFNLVQNKSKKSIIDEIIKFDSDDYECGICKLKIICEDDYLYTQCCEIFMCVKCHKQIVNNEPAICPYCRSRNIDDYMPDELKDIKERYEISKNNQVEISIEDLDVGDIFIEKGEFDARRVVKITKKFVVFVFLESTIVYSCDDDNSVFYEVDQEKINCIAEKCKMKKSNNTVLKFIDNTHIVLLQDGSLFDD